MLKRLLGQIIWPACPTKPWFRIQVGSSGGLGGGGGGGGVRGQNPPSALEFINSYCYKIYILFAKKNAICSCMRTQTPLHKKSRSTPGQFDEGYWC